MKRFTALLLLSMICLMSGCTKNDVANQTEETALSTQNILQDMAYFSKKDVVFDDNFNINGSMFEENGMIYVMGYTFNEDQIIGTMAKLNTSDMSVTYEALPDEVWENVVDFVVTDTGIYIVQSTFDMDTFTESYTLSVVKDNTIISEKPLDTYLNLPDDFWGNINIIAADDNICIRFIK
ncbi:MAG: hypothetical protein IJ334_12815 [Clostridia bacterium]|nr:hypothetical protein [Clostridia bacterium]